MSFDMKRSLLLLVLLSVGFTSFSQERIQYRDTTRYYEFEVNYWFNLHHFLYMEAFLNVKMDSSLLKKELPSADGMILETSLAYYREKLVDQDLRMSDYMTAFKEWVTGEAFEPQQVPEQFKEHFEVLRVAGATYEKHFWNDHFSQAQSLLEENLPLIRATEEPYVKEITKLTRQFWQPEGKVKVDVVFYAKSSTWNPRNRPYTSIFPTHVVMNVFGENHIKGNWVELLYHESAHHLILGGSYFVGGTLRDLSEARGLKTPRQLWHAYLFFFTGEISRKLLKENGVDYAQTYMERNKVFSYYHPYLYKHLLPYINREVTLAEATENFIRDYQSEKD
ncbi:MAG: hypothetical protein Tsb0034_19170 [Ekhidna sp.]